MKPFVLLMMGVYGATASSFLLAGLLGFLTLRSGFTGIAGWAYLAITFVITVLFFILFYREYYSREKRPS